MRLFDDGVSIIEKKFNIPVIGVLPYISLNLGFEDSQSLLNYKQNKQNTKIKVGVIQYPTMSNYNDFEPLLADQEIYLEFINSNKDLEQYDLVILSGSKATIEDLKWLKKVGLYKQLQKRTKAIFGICGGYQMMFNNIIDKHKVEVSKDIKIKALGFFDDNIKFQKIKILKKEMFNVLGYNVDGFEMHHGVSKKFPLYAKIENKQGSFVHAIFDNDNFRNYIFKNINKNYKGFKYQKYKKDTIQEFVQDMGSYINIKKIIKGIR